METFGPPSGGPTATFPAAQVSVPLHLLPSFAALTQCTVAGVWTDNGACYRSHAFATALGESVKHKWTKPYRPQTNGKVERFNRTLATEWAYAATYASETERAAGDDRLTSWHDTLINAGTERKELTEVCWASFCLLYSS